MILIKINQGLSGETILRALSISVDCDIIQKAVRLSKRQMRAAHAAVRPVLYDRQAMLM
ncbi:hypothetical protein ACE3NQ_01810 [Paenibacillus terreus]|uniref:Uncharacterized protein n=1 Tax=Paenibacillus terreus TaxID=1387834 RepID=A0ABV5B1U2_9BACL